MGANGSSTDFELPVLLQLGGCRVILVVLVQPPGQQLCALFQPLYRTLQRAQQ